MWLCRISCAVAGALLFAGAGSAQPRRPPFLQAVPLPNAEISLQRGGGEIARYHHGATLRRPFVYPILGPSGRGLTRMGHPHDPVGHSHHNSFWVSHHDVNGVSFWGDQGKGPLGRIMHQRVEQLTDADAEASLLVVNAWIDETSGKTLLQERRRVAVVPLEKGEYVMLLDLQFTAREPVTLGKTPFGIVGVRMAKSIGVNDGGGTIRNSVGGVDEKGVFWKSAKWVDYSGPTYEHPVQGILTEGITLLDHPSNPNHPSVFHVRNDGWMGASLTFDAERKIEPGTPLWLRYGLYVHSRTPPLEELETRWAAFAKTKVEDLTPKKK